MAINNAKEFAQAVKDGEPTIEVEGDFAKKIFRIKATGAVAWCIAIGAIGVSVVAILASATTAGTSNAVHFVTAPAALVMLGTAATTAISIAVAGGGVGVLNTLRSNYTVKKLDNGNVLLTHK